MKTDSDQNPELAQLSEEGFVDLVFRIDRLDRSDSVISAELHASVDAERVALRVRFPADLRPGFDAEMNLIPQNVARGAFTLERTGPPSDRLLAHLAQLFGVHLDNEAVFATTHLTVIALHNRAFALDDDKVNLKLFGFDTDEGVAAGRYFETFFNLDLSHRLAFWNEKDPDYRTPQTQALTKPV